MGKVKGLASTLDIYRESRFLVSIVLIHAKSCWSSKGLVDLAWAWWVSCPPELIHHPFLWIHSLYANWLCTTCVLQRKLVPRGHMLSHFSRVRLFVTPWVVAHQASLSMGFSRQEYWSGLPCPSPGDLPNPGIQKPLKSRILRKGGDFWSIMYQAFSCICPL